MGENLSLPGRDAIRTPMQWNDGPAGGFSTAAPQDLVRPVPTRGAFGIKKVNVQDQERDGQSLLSWFGRAIRTLRECPEVGVGTCTVIDLPLPRSVLVHRFDAPEGAMLFLHNLADQAVTVDVGKLDGEGRPVEVFADSDYPAVTSRLKDLELQGWGYRWIRLRRSNSN